jgi:hypothetical protein
MSKKSKEDPYGSVRRDTPPPGFKIGGGKKHNRRKKRRRERKMIEKELEELFDEDLEEYEE